MNSGSWLKIGNEDTAELAGRLSALSAEKISSGEYARKDVEYIENLKARDIQSTLDLSVSDLEKIRRLCQLWDLDIKATEIKSHRPVIGPLIVAVKKLTLPVLKVLLKETVKQQREFNATAISLLTDICNRNKPAK